MRSCLIVSCNCSVMARRLREILFEIFPNITDLNVILALGLRDRISGQYPADRLDLPDDLLSKPRNRLGQSVLIVLIFLIVHTGSILGDFPIPVRTGESGFGIWSWPMVCGHPRLHVHETQIRNPQSEI